MSVPILKYKERAGRYVLQPTGYRAFIPAPLPPVPPLQVEGMLIELLSTASYSLGRLNGAIVTLPTPDLFVYMYVRKEAVLSSQIEGTQSSLQNLLAAEAHMLDARIPQDVNEVINYVNAMHYGLERLNSLPISIRLIREIHAELMKGVRGGKLAPGEIRTTQNWIGPAGCTLKEAVFVPPPPQELPAVLGDLEQFLHMKDAIPPLLRIGLAHAQFETIHPFLDGNGRMGRLLITLLLVAQKLLIHPVLYLSYYFKRYRSEYYQRLQAVREEGDWEGWIAFFLRGVIEVSTKAADTAGAILRMRELYRARMTDVLGRGSANGYRLMEALFQKPIISVSTVRELLQISSVSANVLINRLVDIGMLKEITGYARNRRYRFEPYLVIFEDEDGQDAS